MVLAKNIRYLRRRKEWSQEYIAEKLGYKSYTTIQKWEMGVSEPPFRKLKELADLFGVNMDDITDTNMEFSEIESYSPRMQKVISRIPVFSTPVSAGDGEWLSEGTEYEWANFENVPSNTDFALKVKGDSMSPIYNDGDVVFVRQSTFIESGDVGVFRLNGEGYLKMLKGSNLISLNPKYEPVTIKESDDYYPAGKVVGKQEGS